MKRLDTQLLTTVIAMLLPGCVGAPCSGPNDASCLPGSFCKQDTGTCDDASAVGVCMAIPDTCSLISSPVCGCDGNTYGNPCMADAAGVSLAHAGACDQSCCDPAAMPGAGNNPSCFEGATCCLGGQWQCNQGDGLPSCETTGQVCEQDCGGIAGLPCEEGEFCKLNTGDCCCDFQGVCTPIPDACIEIFQPICGCDGQTYSNECLASVSGVSVASDGPCD